MFNAEDLEVSVLSHFEYKEVIIEVYYKNHLVYILNQDEGLDNVKVEFPASENPESFAGQSIPLDVFEKALELAKKSLTRDS